MWLVAITESARVDIMNTAAFYDNQECGIGDMFVDYIEREIGQLAITAAVHRKKFGIHCRVASVFHSLIFYRLKGEVAEVLAVVDGRRNPVFIKRTVSHR